MRPVRIYTRTLCGFSKRAKAILEAHAISFEEVDLVKQPDREEEMIDAAEGNTSVPQIFIAGEYVGGCEDLEELDASGRLVNLIQGQQEQPGA